MSLNSLVLPVLVANIVVFVFLNRERVSTYVAGIRGKRILATYRSAGLLALMVTLGVVAVTYAQNIPCLRDGRVDKACQKRQAAQTPLVAGVIRDSDYDEARAIAKSQGMDVSKWDAQLGFVQYSRGDDAIYNVQPDEQDWTNSFWTAETSKKHPKLAKAINYTWTHAGALAILAILCFLVIQFAGGREADETSIHEQLDPEYRTGFDRDYHGDDAFIVPDGMHSEYESVPVRSRSAAAGR